MMSENIARNMYSSQGIINYTTKLHLVGHFRKLYHDARNHEYQARETLHLNFFEIHFVLHVHFCNLGLHKMTENLLLHEVTLFLL